VGDILEENGLKDSKVDIKKVIRVDLDGDKIDEVFIVATDWDLDAWNISAHNSGRGSYSLIVLRKIIDSKVVNIPIKSQFSKNNPEYEYVYDVPFVLDIDNDGVMEFVTEGRVGAWSKVDFCKVDRSYIKEIYSTAFGA
jgi:hypothetical protein